MGSGLISLNMLTSLWRSLLLAAVLGLVQARPNSEDPQDVVEGSGDEEQDMAISEAVNKVVELVDEVVNDLNDKIEDMEVNLADNEISDKKTKKNKDKKINKKKCSKCARKHFRARNSELCDECDGGQAEATTTTGEITTTTMMEFINKKKEQKIKERCQKCKKRNFRTRNEDFCSEKCSDESEMKAEEVGTESEAEEATTVKSRKAGGQKGNNKNKKGKKSKEERQKLRENRKRNRSRKNGSKNTNKKFAVPLEKGNSYQTEFDTVEVKEYVKRKAGPLESFIKFLFKKN